MKFGARLYALQDPAWAEHYIPYRELKAAIKAAYDDENGETTLLSRCLTSGIHARSRPPHGERRCVWG